MKVGIITLQDNHNYGNRLQNYAVSQIMKDYRIEADTLIIKNKEDYFATEKPKKGFKNAVKTLMPIHFLTLYGVLRRLLSKKNMDDAREREFQRFNMQYITKKTYYVNQYKQLSKNKALQKYDYFLAGSDQIWNPDWAGQDKYFLTFAPPEKRIGFIASIGVSELPEEQKERYTSLLKQMKYISVREESAVQMIEELIHRKVDCFVDPVLLLEKEKWESLMKPPSFQIPEKYVLSFFLGEEPRERIKSFAKNRNLTVIHINQKEYKEYYLIGPENLLYMIKNATVVMTDSFHVTAFSIMFGRQFYVFQRRQLGMENMFSRMVMLLGKFQMTERIQDEGEIRTMEDISSKRYMQAEMILEEERRKFDNIMKNVLGFERGKNI